MHLKIGVYAIRDPVFIDMAKALTIAGLGRSFACHFIELATRGKQMCMDR